MARHVVIVGAELDSGADSSTGTSGRLASVRPLHLAPSISREPLRPLPGLRRRPPRRVRWPIPVLAAGTMAVVLVLQLTRTVPEPVLASVTPAPLSVPGSPPSLAWPSVGQAAVSVPSTGLLLQSGPETAVPVASLTKIMTAYQVLEDHPLSPSAAGPEVVMSAADEADSAADARANATSVPVVAGQSFSERQLLDGLIVHSANDFADALARWDAGSVPAFVDKMNAQAARLGMWATHYVDPSGIEDAGVSSAADQLRLAGAAMSDPAFATVASQPAIIVPGVGLLANYVPAVGADGVVGVKSGFTQAAMGCVVLAAERIVAGRQLLVLAALTGQQGGADPIRAADATAISLIDAVAPSLSHETLLRSGRQVATLSVPWAPAHVPVVTAAGLSTLVWPGDTVRYRVQPLALHGAVRAGQRVGTLVVTDGNRRFTVALVAQAGLPSPSLRWRFAHH